ncbi:conserved hypothetical protein [Ricinus communis]|uniref:Uncharacterized protein n=1 Tax=Ricinus communis TaxID=3988 RepID=B9SU74_RICCO|nr:conserved hypothetical protein [Ricinus communis]
MTDHSCRPPLDVWFGVVTESLPHGGLTPSFPFVVVAIILWLFFCGLLPIRRFPELSPVVVLWEIVLREILVGGWEEGVGYMDLDVAMASSIKYLCHYWSCFHLGWANMCFSGENEVNLLVQKFSKSKSGSIAPRLEMWLVMVPPMNGSYAKFDIC